MSDPESPGLVPRVKYRLCKAALTDDWPTAAAIFDQFHDACTGRITCWGETALHLAVGSNRSHRFVAKLTDRILTSRAGLNVCNASGNNALHYAAKVGNLKDAKVLVKLDPTMTHLYNSVRQTPLHVAAACGQRNIIEYLLDGVGIEQENWSSPFVGSMGLKLVVSTIEAGFYDLALKLLREYPDLTIERDARGTTALLMMATKRTAIPSVSGESWAHHRYMNQCAKEMVILICNTAVEKGVADIVIKGGIFAAIENGTCEFIRECLNSYPVTLWDDKDDACELFLSSIRYRQTEVFEDLVSYMTLHKAFLIEYQDGGENVLHLAARLPSPDVQVGAQEGVLLQLLHEIGWYKAVEKLLDALTRHARNREGKTPLLVFIEEHKVLNKKAGKWIMDVASSATLAAALIFTASFTAFLNLLNNINDQLRNMEVAVGPGRVGVVEASVLAFLLSDVLAFICSASSMILFLSTLGVRYNECHIMSNNNNNNNVPLKLFWGFIFLYVSIWGILVAFGQALVILLSLEKGHVDLSTYILAGIILVPSCLIIGHRSVSIELYRCIRYRRSSRI